MSDIFTGPLPEAIGVTLLHTLWQGAIVAAILAVALSLARRRSAAVRYAIACGALAAMLLLAIGTAARIYEPQAAGATPANAAVVPNDAVIAMSAFADAPTLVAAARAHVPQILLGWLAGVLVLSIRLGVNWWRVQTIARRNAAEADEVWQRTAKRLAAALGLERPVRIVMSSAVDVPSVAGWLKPVVLLTASSISGLTFEQLEMVLAHELAHIRRHDFLVNAMQSVVETLMFYNPAVWWISRQIRIERENCCDDLAVGVCGDAVAYARALAQLESMRSVPAAAAAANGGSLLARVRRLVGSDSESSLFSNGWTAAAALTSFVLLLGFATAPLFAAAVDAEPQTAGTNIEVTAPPAKPAVPAAPKAKPKVVVHDNKDMDFDFDFDFDVPEPPDTPAVPRVPPVPPIHIHKMHVPDMTAMKAEIRANLEAALAGMDREGDAPSNMPPGKLSVNDLIALKVQKVTPEYMQQMRAALGNVSVHDLIAMKVQGVTPEFVQSLVAAGYDHLAAHDVIRLKMFGVTADFIREMQKYKVK